MGRKRGGGEKLLNLDNKKLHKKQVKRKKEIG